MHKTTACFFLMLLPLSLRTAKADQVILTNGDHLFCTVVKVGDNKMTIHSPFLGDSTIALKDIRTFSTDGPVEIHLSDGSIIHRQIQSADPGQFALGGTGDLHPQSLPIAALSAINPPAVAWTGNFRFGGTLARGNTYTDTVNAGYNLDLKLPTDELSTTGEYNYGHQKDRTTGISNTTVDNWELGAKDEHNFTPRFYAYVDADVAKDRIAFLDLRFTPSAGVGYHFFTGPKLKLAGEAGLAWLYQQYTNATPTEEDFALKFAYHLTYDFNDKVNLFNDLTYIPSAERGSTYLITSDVGIHSKISDKFFTELRIEWDYNSAPAIGALKNDTRYILSVGYTL